MEKPTNTAPAEASPLAPEPGAPQPRPITLADIYRDKIFETKSLRQPQWLKDGKRFSYLDVAPGLTGVSTIWIYNIETGERTTAIPSDALKLPARKTAAKKLPVPQEPSAAEETAQEEGEEAEEPAPPTPEGSLEIHGYQWSPDERSILFAKLPKRRSSAGDKDLYIYSLEKKKLKRLNLPAGEYRNVKWAPDGQSIGYVRRDEICVFSLKDNKEQRLTHDAAPTRYNGRFGWVYEEELDLADGWAFSPDGSRIAYYQIDETLVPEIPLTRYDDLHLKPISTRYPKSGDPNPRVRIGIIPVQPASSPASTVWADLGPDTDIYITGMNWTRHGDLLLQRMNRLQNELTLLKVNAATGQARSVLTEKSGHWIDAPGEVKQLEHTDEFLWPSERDGYRHLYLYSLSGTLIRQVTQGAWDVDSICGVDEQHRLLYFTAANPGPLERQLFYTLLDGGGEITRLSEENGTHSPLFSPNALHYLDTHSNRLSAPHVRLHEASGTSVRSVLKNPTEKLEQVQLGTWEFVTIPTSDGISLNAAILKPANFDPKKRYAVLMNTYGGPGSQVVRDSYGGGGGLENFLAQNGFLFVMVDGRGSGFRGRDFKQIVYQDLGHWEVHDQIEGAKWLAKLPYVDPKRIGIWGWSYGGYMASMCILEGADVFRAAAAVAPVTHWSYYDSIYTERYMRRPVDNLKGYVESSPITHADKLKGAFLMMHGTADDNVHFQNCAELAAELQKKEKSFQMMVYPGKHHGLEGVSIHVFETLTEFFRKNLGTELEAR